MALSVLTLARGRRLHLQRLIEGLCRSDVLPDELLIVDMGGPQIELPNTPFPIRILSLIDDQLPLAQARNMAALQARHDILIFLDVDCIPMVSLLEAMRHTIENSDALVCAEIYYLNEAAIQDSWHEDALRHSSVTHPVRSFPETGTRVETNPGLFWSLAFAVRAATFKTLRGFDPAFIGYGGEDTDFGFRAKAAGVDLLFLGGTGAFHQFHVICDPPLQHFDDIIRNAEIFHKKWNIWPMQGWLADFERMELIHFSDDKIVIIRRPSAGEIKIAMRAARAIR